MGFDLRHAESGFAIVGRDEAEVHLWGASDEDWRDRADFATNPVSSGAESFIAGTASCRIEVVEVDALFEELREAGVLHPTMRDGAVATEWGTREVHALDADGNLVTFFSRES